MVEIKAVEMTLSGLITMAMPVWLLVEELIGRR